MFSKLVSQFNLFLIKFPYLDLSLLKTTTKKKGALHFTYWVHSRTLNERRAGDIGQWQSACQHTQGPGFNPQHYKILCKRAAKLFKKLTLKIFGIHLSSQEHVFWLLSGGQSYFFKQDGFKLTLFLYNQFSTLDFSRQYGLSKPFANVNPFINGQK